jgi:hypothetical protein
MINMHEPSGIRTIERLRQMAREQRAAVAADDVEALCHIASLVPRVMEQLWKDDVRYTPSMRAAIEEVLDAHRTSEAYLTRMLSEVAAKLKQCAGGRRAAHAYRTRRTVANGWFDQSR